MSLRNILIINQPLGNRGDESAHRALVRSLNKAFPETKITILNYLDYRNAEEEFIVEHPNNEYIRFVFKHNLGASPLDVYLTQWGLVAIGIHLHPIFRKLLPYYKKADLVLSAPGGICMGGFQDWHHLFLLKVAKVLHKPLAYYSRSFGPFPSETWKNRRFKKLALEMLSYFDFLSIRDRETMFLADSMGIKYVPAIDTAFLEQPQAVISDEIRIVLSEKYIVFVPNSLTWHYAYKDYSQDIIDALYIRILNELTTLYPEHRIIMLPQLSPLKINRDYVYFEKLMNISGKKNCMLLPDCYGSDIQQTIIRNADFVVGARYHSIVFAINNGIPFLALNYEHKMLGLLKQLGLEKYGIDVKGIFGNDSYVEQIISLLRWIVCEDKMDKELLYKGNAIAQRCFNRFVQKYSD